MTRVRALIVDDEPLARTRLQRLLRARSDVEVVGSAANADEAVEKITDLAPDLVFLDVQMPGLGGFDVLRHLILRKPELLKATVVMTAATDESLQFIDKNAVAGILRKPFEVASLPAMVRGVIG